MSASTSSSYYVHRSDQQAARTPSLPYLKLMRWHCVDCGPSGTLLEQFAVLKIEAPKWACLRSALCLHGTARMLAGHLSEKAERERAAQDEIHSIQMLVLQIRILPSAPGPSMRTLLRIISQQPYKFCFTSWGPIPQVSQYHSASRACKVTRLQCALRYSASATESPKAAALIIGNEILNGSVVDTNTPWLAKLLHSRGVDLVRAEYVPDDEADIGSTVLRLKERVGPGGFVFTSGGIGATHDDVTYSAIAAAFGTELQLHEPTVERMRENYSKRGVELNEARLRMATLPAAAEVLYTPDLWVPLVNLHSVYILPGIPRLFKAMIEANKDPFKGPQSKFRVLYTNTVEGDLADALRAIAEKHSKVGIGSYPNTAELDAQQSYRVKLQLVSRDEQALEAAVEEIKQGIHCLHDIPSGS